MVFRIKLVVILLFTMPAIAYCQQLRDRSETSVYFFCEASKKKARNDIIHNMVKYHRMLYNNDDRYHIFQYIAFITYNVKLEPHSQFLDEEASCYNQVVDSYFVAKVGTGFEKAVYRKMDSIDKSVPFTQLPTLYNSLGLDYLSPEEDTIYLAAPELKEKLKNKMR